MRILLVSTLKRKIAPDFFASRSRIIYQIAEGMIKKGHSVSILGTGDSYVPGATIIPVLEKGWVDLPPVENEFVRQTSALLKLSRILVEIQDDFDVIHNHTYPDVFPSVIEDQLKIPLVTTLHAVATDYLDDLMSHYKKSHFVALSQSYKKLYTQTPIEFVVYNGVDTNLYKYQEKKENYLFWLGRLPKGKDEQGNFLDPKGVRWAIALAQKTKTPLYMAGSCEDPAFFEQDIKPHLSDTIQWVGDVSPEQSVPIEKIVSLMQGAKAFLMTINQEEPFGLVMAEAGSCGTPVIAFDRGSVREVVKDGLTGIIVPPSNGVEGLADALMAISGISPSECRNHIKENFSVETMVKNYEDLYQRLQ